MALKGVGMVTDFNHTGTGTTFALTVKYGAIDTSSAQGSIIVNASTTQTPAQIRQAIANAVRDKLVSDYGYSFTIATDTVVLLCADFNVQAVS